jgi:hypothetical protein
VHAGSSESAVTTTTILEPVRLPKPYRLIDRMAGPTVGDA